MRRSLALAAGLLWALLSTPSAWAHDDDIELFLANTGVDLDARSRARLGEDDGRQHFKVDVEQLTAGRYPLFAARTLFRPLAVHPHGERHPRTAGAPPPVAPPGTSL